MTSLQKQLAVIAANSSNELDLKAQRSKYSKSLLFEPAVAANQSLDVLFQICHQGFQELCALDGRYLPYERSLFSEQSKGEDREQMTQAENDALDKLVNSFLGLLGSRLLLKPAFKALEWLLRRFRIHEHSTDDLLLTCLPYHSTPLFSTIMSILPTQLSPAFRFLHPYVSSLASPPRSAIVLAATQNQSFFTKLNQHVLHVCKQAQSYPNLISFWAGVNAQAIDGLLSTSQSGRLNIQQQREEDLLTRLLPILNDCLSIRKNPELALGCYVIITILCSRANMEEKVSDAFMVAVAQSMTASTCATAIGCLSVIVNKKQQATIPKSVLRSLARVPDFGSLLAAVGQEQPIERFLIAIVSSIIASANLISSDGMSTWLESLAETEAFSRDLKAKALIAVKAILPTDPQMTPALSSFVETLELYSGEEFMDAPRYIEMPETVNDAESEVDVEEMKVPDDFDAAGSPLSLALKSMNNIDPFATSQSAQENSKLLKTIAAFSHSVRSGRMPKEATFLQQLITSNEVTQRSVDFFLITVFSTSRSPGDRKTALMFMSKCRGGRAYERSEVELMTPYLITALADSSRPVRTVAGMLFTKLRSTKGATTTALEKFIDLTRSNLEECVTDAEYIKSLLKRTLDDSASPSAEKSVTKLKSTARAEVFSFLAHRTQHDLITASKYLLLQMLNGVDRVNGKPRSEYLLGVLGSAVTESRSSLSPGVLSAHALDKSYSTELVRIVHPKDDKAVEMLFEIVLAEEDSGSNSLQLSAFQRLAELWQKLNKTMTSKIAKSLFQKVLSKGSDPALDVLAKESLHVLRSVSISTETLVDFMEDAMAELTAGMAGPPAKRQRLEGQSNGMAVGHTSHSSTHLAKITLALELIDGPETIADVRLFYKLFEVLQNTQDYKISTKADITYLQSLTVRNLQTLLQVLDSQRSVKLESSLIRSDLLVECARDTSDAQTRSSALLLLARLAKSAPQIVLHSVMPIFTVMSATMARQGDEYSAHVVDETVTTVIPLLAQTLRRQRRELASAAAEILLSFAAAYEHIPPSRRFRLFTLLATSLGPRDSLFAIIAALVDNVPGNEDAVLFSSKLLARFNDVEYVLTIVKYLGLILDAYSKKPDLFLVLIRQPEERTNLESSIVNLLHALPSLLENIKNRTLTTDEIDIDAEIGTVLERIVEVSRAAGDSVQIREACSQVMRALLDNIPMSHFARSVELLLERSTIEIRRTLLKTVELRLKTKEKQKATQDSAMRSLLPKLVDMLEDAEQTLLKPNILACLDQVCQRFGKLDMSETFRAAQIVTGTEGASASNPIVRVLSLYCLTSFVGVLDQDFIPLFKIAWNVACDTLRNSLRDDTNAATKLHSAAYSLLISIADALPFMVTKDSLSLVLELSLQSAQSMTADDELQTRVQFLTLSATRLEATTVFGAINQVWLSSIFKGEIALQEQITMLHSSILERGKSVIAANASIIFKIFDQGLSLRSSLEKEDPSMYSAKQIDSMEQALLDALMAFVFKINDTSFRPFFINVAEKSAINTGTQLQDSISKATTLFNFVFTFSEKLTSIVTSYFGYILDQAASILTEVKLSEQGGDVLRTAVLRALQSSFKHDQDDFWQNPSHFGQILEPLIKQLGPTSTKQMRTRVIPVLTEFAAATISSEHCKTINQAIMQLFRSDVTSVRLAAVHAQQSLTERLGDEWLSHLPEMLPFISELQEDDDETVERETHRWIKKIEEVIGESLNAMLQ